MEKILSIIVPVYKTGKTLSRCLDSIFRQVGQGDDAIEVLAVNDASPDDCGVLLEEYRKHDPRLRVVTHERNKGEAGAHNTGIEESGGEYFTFVDSDDALRDGAIRRILGIIRGSHPDLIHYAYARVDEQGRYLSRSWISVEGLHDVATDDPRARKSIFYDTAFGIMTAGGVYRRAVAPDLRMNPQFPISGERYFGWQFFARCKTIYSCNDILYDYYQYTNSISKVFSDRAVQGLLELNIRYWSEMMAHPQFKSAGKFVFRRLYPAQIGWDYELVFESGREKMLRHEALYFDALGNFLKGGTSLRELGPMHFYLQLACRFRSRGMLRLYRQVFCKFIWKVERRVKRVVVRLCARGK